MNPYETTTTTATAHAQAGVKSDPPQGGRYPSRHGALRRAPSRSLVLAQSWIPFSVSQRGQAGVRQSTLRAAEAFTLLSSELATRRGEAKPPTA